MFSRIRDMVIGFVVGLFLVGLVACVVTRQEKTVEIVEVEKIVEIEKIVVQPCDVVCEPCASKGDYRIWLPIIAREIAVETVETVTVEKIVTVVTPEPEITNTVSITLPNPSRVVRRMPKLIGTPIVIPLPEETPMPTPEAIQTEIPEIPETPEVPENPETPEIPEIVDIPDEVPEIPSELPELPPCGPDSIRVTNVWFRSKTAEYFSITDLPGVWGGAFTFEISDVFAWDSHEHHAEQAQQNEQVRVVFARDSKIVLATPFTGDVSDDSNFGTWESESFYSGELNAIDEIGIQHYSLVTGDRSVANSLYVSMCISASEKVSHNDKAFTMEYDNPSFDTVISPDLTVK